MTDRRRDRATWVALILVFAALAGWNLWQSWRLRGEVARLEAEVGRARGGEVEVAETYRQAQAAAVELAGRRLAWPAGLEPVADAAAGGAPAAPGHAAGHRLVMYFSELSCNTCREREAVFLSGLAGATGGAGVALVVHADNPRYVSNFLQRNGISGMAVFLDRDAAFARVNGVGATPCCSSPTPTTGWCWRTCRCPAGRSGASPSTVAPRSCWG